MSRYQRRARKVPTKLEAAAPWDPSSERAVGRGVPAEARRRRDAVCCHGRGPSAGDAAPPQSEQESPSPSVHGSL